jgi:hypothetical protein
VQLVISVVHVGNKQNTNTGKREKKLPAGVAKEASTWEDLLMHEFGMVTSDLGCSFHGMHGSGALNENDMIGYLAKGDGLKLINWPDKAVTIDKYGYPNVCIEVTHAEHGPYQDKQGYFELKAYSF